MKLLQTQDYLLLIDEGAEIKKGDYILEKEDIINVFPDYLTDLDECEKVVAYYPTTKEAKELDLPLLPPFEDVDVERLAEINSEYLADWQDKEFYITSFIEGYKAAHSKQFSLEDMKIAFHKGRLYQGREGDTTFESFIQSLSTQQLPKEFVPEYNLMNKGYDGPEDYPYQECKVLKTTTNSSEKIELVGTYKY